MGSRQRRRERVGRLLEATTKTEDGEAFPASAYAYVPDPSKPSTWKLRLWESPDGGPTTAQVGRAVAALSPGGFRGQKVQIPAKDLPAVKKKVLAAWKKAHAGDGQDPPASLKEALAGGRTMDEVKNLVHGALQDQVDGYPWLQDLSDDWVAYEANGTTFQMPYEMDDDGNVTFGEPTEVEPRRTYVPVANDDGESNASVIPPTVESATEGVADRIHGRVIEARGTDEGGGRVYDVQILAFGDSLNGRRYPSTVMQEAVGLYEGAKAYDHHRTDDELASSTIAGLVGSYRNVKATASGIVGELHLLPSAAHAAEALDATLEAQSKGLPPVVGISHDVMANYRPVVEAGKRFMEATRILKVNSADVVADPAAGGRATRMVAGGSGTSTEGETDMTLKELLEKLRAATPEERATLLAEADNKAVLTEFGLDESAVGRLLDPAPAPTAGPVADPAPAVDPAAEPVAVGTTESIARASVLGGVLIRHAVAGVGLDDRYVESITARLPERFTEAELQDAVKAYGDMRRELEAELLVRQGGRAPHTAVSKDERDKKIAALDALFDPSRALEGYRTLKQAFVDITGTNANAMSPAELAQMVMRESIGDGAYDSAASRGLESAQSGTWNLILGDSITRRMIAMYQQPNLQTWRAVVSSIVPIVDFRTQRIERLGGYGTLPGVNQGAPYQPLTTPGNEEATYSITKRGGTEDLTLETIANDDIRAVQRIPTLLGLAAAQTLYRFVWDIFITNPTYTPDSTALFAAGHNNTATNALSNGNLSAGRAALRKQSAYGDSKDILSILPKFLVVPTTLEALAFELTESPFALPTSAPDGGATNIPNLHQGMSAIVVDYWDASSSTTWFLVADPNMVPTIELGFYNGQVDPELFVQNDPTVGSVFTADKLTYKIRHIYGGNPVEFRGLYRGNT